MILAAIGGYTLSQIAIAIVFVLFLIGAVLLMARQAQVKIPDWVWHLAGLVIAAVLIIVAIKFVASL